MLIHVWDSIWCWCVGYNLPEKKRIKVNKTKNYYRTWLECETSPCHSFHPEVIDILVQGKPQNIFSKDPVHWKPSRLRHQSIHITWCQNRRRYAAVGCCTWEVPCPDRAKTACKAFRSRCAASIRWRVRERPKASTAGWVSGQTEFCWRMLTRTGNRSRGSSRSSRCTTARLCVRSWSRNVATLTPSRNSCHSTRHSPEHRGSSIRQSLRPSYDAPRASRSSSATRSSASGKRPLTL